jgi:hypothetical protein
MLVAFGGEVVHDDPLLVLFRFAPFFAAPEAIGQKLHKMNMAGVICPRIPLILASS